MDARETFGARLRSLRRARMMSQRDLAGRVGLDFTYVSKIENDRSPPPSASTIERIATELAADKDELLALAGKVPDDIQEMFRRDPSAISLFRSFVAERTSRGDRQRPARRGRSRASE